MLEHYLRPPKRTLPQLLAAIALVGMLAAFLSFQALKVRDSAASAERHAERLRAAKATQPVVKKSVGMLEEQKKWESLHQERDFDWPSLFAAVERTGSNDVELLQFRPDKGNRQVLLGGEARDQKALMRFLDILAAQPTLAHVHLSHQQQKKRERLETIVFEVKARIVD